MIIIPYPLDKEGTHRMHLYQENAAIPEILPGRILESFLILNLCDKVRVIEAVNGGLSHPTVTSKFGMGRTQINNIIADQENIQKMYNDDSNAHTKYLSHHQLQYPEIDEECWKFFCKVHSKNIPVNGPMLLAEANEIALKHNYDKFTASNGWLQHFSTHHLIKFANLHDEFTDVSDEAVQQWKEKLPKICAGYHPRDIFNCNETGVFF